MAKSWLILALVVAWHFCPVTISGPGAARAQDAPPAKQTGDDVDDALLRQLDDALEDDLWDGLGDGEDQPAPLNTLDEALLEGLGDGEDIGAEEEDPLLRVGRRMRAVEEQIAGLRSGEATQRLQRRIVDELNDLIKQVRKQCQAGQSASSSQQDSQREQVQQPDSPAGANAQTASNTAAADSTDRLDSTAAAAAEMNRLKEMLKNVWGHLPEKVRDQMLQNATESFLPKYSEQIEEYFKRLVEINAENR